MITYEEADREFRLDEEGRLWWRRAKQGRAKGKAAGSLNSDGYVYVMVNGKRLAAHNIVWLLKTGEWPKQQIDHINRIPGDNRFENLRDVSPSENALNRITTITRKLPANVYNTRGIYYVWLQRDNKIYRAPGGFFTIEQAVAARDRLKAEIDGTSVYIQPS